MSFVHIVYVGNFERDEMGVRFASPPNSPILKPVVRQALDAALVNRLAELHRTAVGESIPEAWSIWAEDGYLGFDRHKLTLNGIEFLKQLIASTGCQLVDFNARREIQVDELAVSGK